MSTQRRMDKKFKNILNIVLCLILSLAISFTGVFFYDNHSVFNKKSNNNPNIIKTNDFIYKDGKYISNGAEPYIILNNSNDQYIKNIEFSYENSKDFEWKIELYDSNDNIVESEYSTSHLLNKTIKNIKSHPAKIKIIFGDENISISNFRYNNDIFIDWYSILSIMSILFLILLVLLYRKILLKNLSKLYLIVSICLCFSFILILPKHLYESWDDQIHYNRIVQLFSGEQVQMSRAETLLIKGDIYRDNIQITTKEEKSEFYNYINKLHKKTKNRTIKSDQNTNYTRLVYIPFFLGYKLANLLGFDLTTCIIISKLFNAIAYCLLMFFVIKKSKYGKHVLFIIGLFPTCLFLASQFSYDPLIIASLTLASALFINMISEKEISKRDILLFIMAIVWGSLPKAIYCPMLLLLLFLPNEKFANKKQAYIIKAIILLITLLLLSTFVLPAVSGTIEGDPRGGNTSVSAQLYGIFKNPIRYVYILSKFTFLNIFQLFLGNMNVMGFCYTIGPSFFDSLYGIELILLIYMIINTKITEKFKIKYKIIFALLLFIIYVLICTSLYLSFTPIGSSEINGVQNRYFIPVLFTLFSLFFCNKDSNNQKMSVKVKTTIVTIIIGITILVALVFNYKIF